MKRALKAILWMAALAAILFGMWQGGALVHARRQAATAAPREEQALATPEVAVAEVRLGDVASNTWVTGEVRPLKSVEIVSKVSGRLELLRLPDGTPVEEGAEVQKGDVVAVIEHRHLAAAVRSAEAAVASAKAARETARVNAADATREKERWAELRRGGSGTQQQLDLSVTAYERALAQLNQAEAQIAQAQAALEQAKTTLGDATIEAPFSGVVARKHVDEGAFVGPSAPLFRLDDLSRVEITGGVAGRHFARIRPGETRASVEVDAFPGETFDGTVSRVRPELDRATRTAMATICVPNPGLKLKPGMYARIRLLLNERRGVPLVPESALIRRADRTQVYAVEDGHVRARGVRTGLEEGAMVEVTEGLGPGDLVVARGQQLLCDGMAVKPVKEGSER